MLDARHDSSEYSILVREKLYSRNRRGRQGQMTRRLPATAGPGPDAVGGEILDSHDGA
jgi:hypothetical protein